MTDHDDELASAYLDGEVSDNERARVEADPALMARAVELRAVRDTIASVAVEQPDPATVDATIRAAVHASTVIDLTAERARRRVRVASIAAAVLLVVGAVGVLLRNSDTSTSTTSTAAGGSTAAEAAADQAAPAAGAFGATGSGSRAVLGSFSDRASLVDAARAALATEAQSASGDLAPATTASTREGASTPRCGVAAPSNVEETAFTGSAELEDREVQVDVFRVSDGGLVLVVTDALSCAEIFSQRL